MTKLGDLAKPEAWDVFRTHGVLRLDSVDPYKVQQARHEAFRVFHEPSRIDTKRWRRERSSGYTPPGIEGVADQPANLLRHFWDVTIGDGHPNRRCEFSSDLVRSMEHLGLELAVIMLGVFYYMERGLGEHAAGLHAAMVSGRHGLRATHYPWRRMPVKDGILFPRHRDFSVVTVFVGGAEPGLQIEQDGQWVDVSNPLGSIVIMAGTMLRFWSGGPEHPDRMRGVPHRVIESDDERLSFSFFTEPQPETILPHSDGMAAGQYVDNLMRKVRGQ